jgi:hypothetical protein
MRAIIFKGNRMSAKAFGFLIAAVVLSLPGVANAKSKRLFVVAHVAANKGWQKMRLTLGGKGILRFKAEGKWIFNLSQPPVGGDGAANLSTAGRANYTFSGPAGREGQLIGKIGGAPPFVAGAGGVHTITANETGRLSLMINDDVKQSAGNGLTDNSGRLRVRIDYVRE